MSSKSIGLCKASDQERAVKLIELLGDNILMPDCATVTVGKKDEILATQTNYLGRYVLEISKHGEVYRSSYCSEDGRRDRCFVDQEPCCRDFHRVLQDPERRLRPYPVSPDKMAKARALILGTDKPKVK